MLQVGISGEDAAFAILFTQPFPLFILFTFTLSGKSFIFSISKRESAYSCSENTRRVGSETKIPSFKLDDARQERGSHCNNWLKEVDDVGLSNHRTGCNELHYFFSLFLM